MPRRRGLILILTSALLLTWLTFALWPASLDRDWIAEHAVAPTVTFAGDTVVVDGVRDLFVSQLEEAHRLGREPACYNTLIDNCTSRPRDQVDAAAPGMVPPTWKVVFPGYTDELMIGLGRLRGEQDLERARQRWWITNGRGRPATPPTSPGPSGTPWPWFREARPAGSMG